MRLAGIELYFDDLEGASTYYSRLGLALSEEEKGHYAKFAAGDTFICLERKGSKSYPSKDKAVVFLEVKGLGATIERLGPEQVVQLGPETTNGGPSWAVLQDPEGHNVLLLEVG